MQYNIYLYFQAFFLPRQSVLSQDFVRIILCTIKFLFLHRILPLNDTEDNVKHVLSPVYVQTIHISTVVEQWRPTLHDKRGVTLNTVVSDVRHYYSFWKPSGGRHHLSKLDSRLPGIYDLRSAKISQLVFYI